MILETIVIIVAIILLLVVTHELGHFFVAKYCNIRVEEFGIGIPPRVLSRKFGETLYSLNLLPFGGFVRIFGEEEDINDPRSFSSQVFAKKFLVVVAGVAANVVVGFLILTFLAWWGTPRFAVGIEKIAPASPAETAGFHTGDIIMGFDGIEHDSLSLEEVEQYISLRKGAEAVFIVKREDAKLEIKSFPRENPPAGEGALGVVIGPENIGLKRTPWYASPIVGARDTLTTLSAVVEGLGIFFGQLFSRGSVPAEVIGPIGIAKVARDTFHVGARLFLELVALLSLNLAVMNVLPVPALDGGRLLFFVIEKIRGREISTRVSHIVHSTFLLLLIGFLLWITYRDIVRLL